MLHAGHPSIVCRECICGGLIHHCAYMQSFTGISPIEHFSKDPAAAPLRTGATTIFAPPCSDMVSAQLELHKYATGRKARVITSLTMLKQHLFK